MTVVRLDVGASSRLGKTAWGVFVLLAACAPPDDSTLDAGPRDSGSLDSGALDSGAMDSGMDSGVLDSGTDPDAPPDASTLDASDGGWGPCSVSGAAGTCLPTAECPAASMAVPGFCPGPSDIQCCVPRDASVCDPTAVPLPNEGLVEEPGEGGCPSGMIPVAGAGGFCIHRFEASLVDADTGASVSPFFNPGSRRVRAVSLRGAIPQAYISGTQARAACETAGLRLCTDTEWLAACQGSMGLTYPYGDTRETGRCNDHRDVHPAIEWFGTSDPSIYSMLDHPCIDQLPMSLAPTGSFAGCESESGALDMMGNLHEWTADPAGTFRGGYYVDTVINGNGCLYRTTAHDAGHWDYSTGFRCCS